MGTKLGTNLADDDLVEQHEINVTPFIDVILVLLIVFMVAAPLSTVDIAVQLPAATAKPQPRPEKPIYVTIKANLEIAIGEDTVGKAMFLSTVSGRSPSTTPTATSPPTSRTPIR